MSIINKVAGGLANITTYDANTGSIIDITVSGNVTAAYIIGDGSNLSNINAGNLVGAYGNANVAAYLPTYTGAITANSANVTGNVLGANFIGNGQYLSNINIANIAGSYSNSNVASYLPNNTSNISGNVITGNLFFGDGFGLSNIPYANITNAYSNANVASYLPNNTSNISGNVITGNLFFGDGFGLSNIPYANITNAYSNVNVASYLPNNTSNISGNVITGNLLNVNGPAFVAGNLTVSGNVNYTDVTDLVVGDPLIFVGANNVSDIVDLGMIVTFDDGVAQHGGFVRDASDGVWKLFSNVIPEPNTVVDFSNAIYDTLQAGFFLGDGGLLSNINAGNLVGAYSNANVANYLPTFTGTLTAGNANVTGNIIASNFIGNGQYLSNINIANIAGSYSNSNVASYLPNNTSNISGNVITGNLFFGNGFGLSNIPYANITNAYSNVNVAFYLPNNTSNISGNVITGNLFSGNGSQLTNLPIASIIGNGTSNVRIPTANGNITMTINAASAFNLSATSVSVGVGAGSFAQSQFGIAIGENAGQNLQGDGGIAIGAAAGQETQGSGAIAIG